jgi:hypothetical protein
MTSKTVTTKTFVVEECIPPTKENAKTSEDVERMFNSHQWKLSKAESQYNSKGVLIRMTCERCGAKKAAILMEDDKT